MGRKEAIFALIDELAVAFLAAVVIVLVLKYANIISTHTALVLSAIIIVSFTIVGYLAAKEQLKRPQTGMEALVGKSGRAVDDLNPSGIVMVNGEYWNAIAVKSKNIKSGSRVVVKGVRGLTLLVDEVEEQRV